MTKADLPIQPTTTPEYAIMDNRGEHFTIAVVAEDDDDAQEVAEHWDYTAPARAPHSVLKRLRTEVQHTDWEVLERQPEPEQPKPEITERVLLTALLYSLTGEKGSKEWITRALNHPIPEVQQ